MIWLLAMPAFALYAFIAGVIFKALGGRIEYIDGSDVALAAIPAIGILVSMLHSVSEGSISDDSALSFAIYWPLIFPLALTYYAIRLPLKVIAKVFAIGVNTAGTTSSKLGVGNEGQDRGRN